MAQVVEHQPNNTKAQSSNPSTAEKEKKKKKKTFQTKRKALR
jgi:hypothetical protein